VFRWFLWVRKNDVVLELRVDGKDGEKIGEFRPRPTGGKARDFVARLRPTKGKQPLFVVCRSETDAPIGTVESLTLQKSLPWTSVATPPLAGADGKMLFPQPTNLPRSKPSTNH